MPRGPRGIDPRLARAQAAAGGGPRRARTPAGARGQDGRPARARGDGVRARGGRPVSVVRVEAPARLHLGMLAVGGPSKHGVESADADSIASSLREHRGDAGTRRFGGLGVAIERPAVVLEAEPADELSAEGADAARALAFARRCRDALGLPGGAHLRVLEAIPSHVGLGSGTKLALAVAQALVALHERTL